MRTAILLTLSAALWGQSPTFLAALKAAEAKDPAKAIPLMEKAILEDPNNMRYASEYRMLVLRQAQTLHPETYRQGKQKGQKVGIRDYKGDPLDFERSFAFFEKVSAANPKSANAHLNYGFAYVDKMPAEGLAKRILYASKSADMFTKSVETDGSWIALYTRGNSYLFWPFPMSREYAPRGVEDLERAYKIQKALPLKSYHVRVFISLGDGYWKTSQMEKAQAMWAEGLKSFPDNQALKDRVSKEGDDLTAVVEDTLDYNKRVDTDLKELWSNP